MEYTESTMETLYSVENGSGASVSADDWFKGIALSILASIIGGASKLAIRKSWIMQHNDDDSVTAAETGASDMPQPLTLNFEEDGTEYPNTSRSDSIPSWVPYCLRYSGMFGMSVLNPICCVLAMNYASPSILAPFSGLTLVWVILFSHSVVGEKPTNPQVVAALLIIAGEVIVAVFGDHTNDVGVTVVDVTTSYKDPAFIAYLFALALYLSLLTYWIRFSKSHLLRRFAWGCSGGAITGLQNFLKDSLTIMKASEHGKYPWFFYLFVCLAAITAFGGLLILTACMKRYDATYSAASFVGSFVVSASIMSATHYNTFNYLKSIWNYMLYPTGLVVLMVGVCILVRESKDTDEDDESQTPVRKDSEDLQSPFAYQKVDEDSSDSGNEQVV